MARLPKWQRSHAQQRPERGETDLPRDVSPFDQVLAEEAKRSKRRQFAESFIEILAAIAELWPN